MGTNLLLKTVDLQRTNSLLCIICCSFLRRGVEWTRFHPPTASDRLFELDPKSLWLASITLGQLLCWDIPCGFGLVKSMKGDMIMLVHHVIMACVAWAGMFFCPRFTTSFSLDSANCRQFPGIVDFFHPKHFAALTGNNLAV